MWLNRTIAALVLSVSAISGWAAPAWNVEPMEVSNLRTSIGGRTEAIFIRNGAVYRPCEGADWYWFEFSGDVSSAAAKKIDMGKQVMVSYLLTAYTSKSEIDAVIDCTDNQIYEVKLRR